LKKAIHENLTDSQGSAPRGGIGAKQWKQSSGSKAVEAKQWNW
jgi:hypothetical protein